MGPVATETAAAGATTQGRRAPSGRRADPSSRLLAALGGEKELEEVEEEAEEGIGQLGALEELAERCRPEWRRWKLLWCSPERCPKEAA